LVLVPGSLSSSKLGVNRPEICGSLGSFPIFAFDKSNELCRITCRCNLNGESFFITGTVAITVNKIHCYTYKNVIDKCGISVIGIKTAAHFFQHGGDGFCILHVAAAGGANQIFFLLNLMLFGINSGASVFLSQFWGTRDLKNVRRTMGMMYLLGSVAVTLFTLGAVLAPRFLVSFYVHEEPALTMSASYLRIVGISYPVTALSMILSMVCRCTGDVSIPTRASFLSIGFNVGGNALLIFGLCGFPALGLEGAAIATALARTVECLFLVLLVYADQISTYARLAIQWTSQVRDSVTGKPVMAGVGAAGSIRWATIPGNRPCSPPFGCSARESLQISPNLGTRNSPPKA